MDVQPVAGQIFDPEKHNHNTPKPAQSDTPTAAEDHFETYVQRAHEPPIEEPERVIDQLREAIDDIRNFEVKLSEQIKELEQQIEALQGALRNATGPQAEALTRQLNALMSLKAELMQELVLAQTQQGKTSKDQGGGSGQDLTQETLLTVFNLRAKADPALDPRQVQNTQLARELSGEASESRLFKDDQA